MLYQVWAYAPVLENRVGLVDSEQRPLREQLNSCLAMSVLRPFQLNSSGYSSERIGKGIGDSAAKQKHRERHGGQFQVTVSSERGGEKDRMKEGRQERHNCDETRNTERSQIEEDKSVSVYQRQTDAKTSDSES